MSYKIQLLANNKPFSMSIDHLREEFETNVVGTAIVSQVFLPLVEKSTRKTIVNVSSSLGSIGIGMDVRYSSYSVTKTALNMLVCTLVPRIVASVNSCPLADLSVSLTLL